LICSFPAQAKDGRAQVIQNVPINEFSRGKIDASVNELKEEKSLVRELLK
jgi:malate dehydrogenase